MIDVSIRHTSSANQEASCLSLRTDALWAYGLGLVRGSHRLADLVVTLGGPSASAAAYHRRHDPVPHHLRTAAMEAPDTSTRSKGSTMLSPGALVVIDVSR